MCKIALCLLAFVLVWVSPSVALAVEGDDPKDSAVVADHGTTVLAYFRFGEDAFPDASVRMDQFESHLRFLTAPGVRVLSVPDALAGLYQPPPADDKRQVAITIDNAYRSVYDQAWPQLRSLGLPFTLFVSTDLIDGGAPAYMTWDQIRELADAGVTIGLRGASHAHLPALSDLALLKDIRHSLSRIEAELDMTPRLFSYPYGEYGNRVINVLDGHGFVAAFGQHSGVMAAGHSAFALPRFPITEQFADNERFELAINALPLVVSDRTPGDNALNTREPQIGFTVDPAMGALDRLRCFATGQGQLPLTLIGRRVELRLTAPFDPGRARVNCTLSVLKPGTLEPSRWRWLGMNFYVP
ncbi:MAG: polysaccharide deacetylase family protein [Pseudomonadota bacterium]